MSTWFLIAVTAVLAAILLWGVVAPRSQWRVLVGWSTSDPDAAEPGDGIHGVRRAVCALGLVGVLVVGGVVGWRMIEARPAAAAPPTTVQQMWGAPTPRLVDRLVAPVADAPEGLVAGPVGGVQLLAKGSPQAYIVSLPRFDLLGSTTPPGLLGRDPEKGTTAYGASDLLIESSGPLDCIPRAVVGTETDAVVTVSVYWGPPGAVTADSATACDMSAAVLQTVLIPVQLSQPVGTRAVLGADGELIPIVRVPSS